MKKSCKWNILKLLCSQPSQVWLAFTCYFDIPIACFVIQKYGLLLLYTGIGIVCFCFILSIPIYSSRPPFTSFCFNRLFLDVGLFSLLAYRYFSRLLFTELMTSLSSSLSFSLPTYISPNEAAHVIYSELPQKFCCISFGHNFSILYDAQT